MSDLRSVIAAMRRPRLLIRAARLGVSDYRRERDLSRLMSGGVLPSPETAVTQLIEAERGLEDTRREGAASYSVIRHVEVLIALMAETRLLPPPKGV